jgi:NO-binding membrane sensor protein with MHYT domain
MLEVHHFTYGWINPVLAYGMSFLGSLLGLICTARARQARETGRHVGWLVLAAWAIGGTGIWLMHFLAMLGFTVVDGQVRYDAVLTVVSAAAAIGVVGIGVFIVGYGDPSVPKLLAGGLFTGIGVATMHYTGMAAMRVQGDVGYDWRLVAASVGIAVVAATVALWFTLVVQGTRMLTAAAAIMGIAVCGMHYTGMAALRIQANHSAHLSGTDPSGFLMPLMLVVGLALIVVLSIVMAQPAPLAAEREAVDLRVPLRQG